MHFQQQGGRACGLFTAFSASRRHRSEVNGTSDGVVPTLKSVALCFLDVVVLTLGPTLRQSRKSQQPFTIVRKCGRTFSLSLYQRYCSYCSSSLNFVTFSRPLPTMFRSCFYGNFSRIIMHCDEQRSVGICLSSLLTCCATFKAWRVQISPCGTVFRGHHPTTWVI